MRPSLLYSVEERIGVWEDFDKKCYWCDCDLPKPGTKSAKNKTHFDHVIPASKGGSDELTNLRPSCRACNCAKGSKDYIQFVEDHHAKALKMVNRLAQLLLDLRRDPFFDD